MEEQLDINKIIADLIKEGSIAAKEAFEKWINEKRIGFPVDRKTSEILKRIREEDVFIRLKECVGKHQILKFILLGLYISELNKKGERKELQNLKDNLFFKQGKYAINICNMGSTGVIKEVVNYLSELKIKYNYTKEELSKELEKIIDEWNEITLFVKESDQKEAVKEWIENMIKNKIHLFFVFGYGAARETTMVAIGELRNEAKIESRGYLFFNENLDEGGKKKICSFFKLVNINLNEYEDLFKG
ncbi:MAG: hypothetical protein V1911_00435 [Candidatus Micrarchaeota archaeon]